MDGPLISIVIPVYQAEKYLRRGLDSLLQQSDGRWEALCINDGSPDNSAAILGEYAQKDPRFRIFHQENKGVSATRNRGIEQARGTFVTFLDADDWLSAGLVAELHRHACRDGVDIILFDSQVEYSEGTERKPSLETCLRLQQYGDFSVTPECLSYSIGSCCGKAYRRTFLKEKHLRFPLNMRQEDEVFYRCSMAVAGHIYCSDYCGYHYLQTADSYMHTMLQPFSSYMLYLKGIEVVHGYYRENGCLPAWEETILKFLFGQLAKKQHNVTRSELQTMRKETSVFLSKTDLPAHFSDDYRLRFISALSPLRDFFVRRETAAEIYGIGRIGLVKVRYDNGRFERCVTPFSKLADGLKRLFE